MRYFRHNDKSALRSGAHGWAPCAHRKLWFRYAHFCPLHAHIFKPYFVDMFPLKSPSNPLKLGISSRVGKLFPRALRRLNCSLFYLIGLWKHVQCLIGLRELINSYRLCFASTNLNWDFIYSKGFNNCYILLSNISQALENTKFVAGELSLIVSLVLYCPMSVYELW